MKYSTNVRVRSFRLVLTGLVPTSLGFSMMAQAAPIKEPLLQRQGIQFAGGGAAQVGSSFFGESTVNMVYAQPSGLSARLSTEFRLDRLPDNPQVLFLTARDDDAATECPIEIRLNEVVLYEG